MVSELCFDLKPLIFKSIEGSPVDADSNGFSRSSLIEHYLRCLEEEKHKIDAFKRELPLCMHLLTDAIEVLKSDSAHETFGISQPVLEEFIPMKSNQKVGEKSERDCHDKCNWMSSVQLWSGDGSTDNSSSRDCQKSTSLEKGGESDPSAEESSLVQSKSRTGVGVGAILPFNGVWSFASRPGNEEIMPELSLLGPKFNTLSDESAGSDLSSKSDAGVHHSISSDHHANLQSQQHPRKPRRCWSPDLHRRFVNALQQLGGAQAATPKQIRELMKVEGLTNDEVKSHLQKYRLHTKRMPASALLPNQHVLLFGGVCTPCENYQFSKCIPSTSGSPQGPLQLVAVSGTNTEGESCEEEEKSDCYSWRGNLS